MSNEPLLLRFVKRVVTVNKYDKAVRYILQQGVRTKGEEYIWVEWVDVPLVDEETGDPIEES